MKILKLEKQVNKQCTKEAIKRQQVGLIGAEIRAKYNQEG